MRVVLIITHSRKGFTDNMTKAIAEGVREVPNVEAVVKRVNEVQTLDFDKADALAIGSPTYLHYISGELKHLLDDTCYTCMSETKKWEKFRGKPAVAFTSGVNKGYNLSKLQFRSAALKELERILFSTLKMRKIVNGLHLVHAKTFPLIHGPPKILDVGVSLLLTNKQDTLCRNLGKKLALSTRKQK